MIKQELACKEGAATYLRARSLGSSGSKGSNIIQIAYIMGKI
jgi:hypothetical protein